ncbi:MAG TPA: ABC transporter ATP-binding protein [Ktedonobacterales bacterium]|nr:ABC transporter ATP-binding protein [Ktedonobacterales bacterium]
MATETTTQTRAAQRVSAPVALRVRGLTKRYGERLAVDHLDLEIRQGEVFGFLGPNGAGKTTTIRMVLGLIRPTDGSVEILGEDLVANKAAVLPRVGALVEQPALYLYLSGRDNLRAVANTLGGVPESRIDEVLELVGLKGRDGDRVRTYSLGMKQRLGVGMALLHDPELLILDEPANGLDPAGIVEMRDLLRQLAAQGKTVFISSHVLTEVRQICDRVAILSKGKLVTVADIDSLIGSHGAFRVTFEPGRAAEALAVAQRQPWGAQARLDSDGALISSAPGGWGRELNLFLVNSGFAPETIAPYSEDLEAVFLRLTGESGDASR